MTAQPWTCPRCSRIWAPTTKGCETCNAAVDVAALHGFQIEAKNQPRRYVVDPPVWVRLPHTPPDDAFAAEYAPWLRDREDRRLTVVGGSEAPERLRSDDPG